MFPLPVICISSDCGDAVLDQDLGGGFVVFNLEISGQILLITLY